MGMKTDSWKIIEFLAIGMEGNKKTTCQCAMERRNFCWRPKFIFPDLLTPAQLNSGFKLTYWNRLWSKKMKKKAEIDETRRAENNDDIIALSFLHVNQGSSYNFKNTVVVNEIGRLETSFLKDKRVSIRQFRTKQNFPWKQIPNSLGCS